MRVLQLAQFYPPVIGGEERHVRNLSVALAGRGHDVHVATLDVTGFGAASGPPQADPGVTVHTLDNVGRRASGLYPTADRPLALPAPDPLTVRDLARVIERVRPDVVHAHNWLVNSALALPAVHRLPLVLSLHDYGHVCATKRLMRHEQPCAGPSPARCLPCAGAHFGAGRGQVIYGLVRAGLPVRRRGVDVFTPVSSYVAHANGVDVDGSAYEVVPNFVPDALLDVEAAAVPRDPDLPERPYLFFAGDLSAQKGAVTLARAWRHLPADTRPDLVLVGRPTDLEEILAGGAGEPRLHVFHHWDHDRVVSGFVHALAAVLPSEWPDPCPTTVLEAMALGAPLVTTDLGGIADMVRADVSALVVPPGAPGALAAALTRITDPAPDGERLRADLTAAAREHVRAFTQSRVAAQLEGVYARLLG